MRKAKRRNSVSLNGDAALKRATELLDIERKEIGTKRNCFLKRKQERRRKIEHIGGGGSCFRST